MTNNRNQENELAILAGITSKKSINRKLAEDDEINKIVQLLNRINGFQPRDKWIVPILKSNECSDFKTQLLTAIEEYEAGTKIDI